MVRFVGLILAACFLIASAPPEPPAELEPYIVDGKYDPGDFGWLRGKFASATLEEVATIKVIEAWVETCSRIAGDEAKVQMEQRGVMLPDTGTDYVSPVLCSMVSASPDVSSYTDFEDFSAALRETRPIFAALSVSADMAQLMIDDGDDTLIDKLEKRPLQEQMLRNAISWVWEPREGFPTLTERQKPIFQALLTAEIRSIDRENTQWLKEVVSKQGWPTISDVGENASQNAWLLVQHADGDPVFQLDVLRMMEPLVVEGEVSSRNYAYLYDRVMLKLTGKQRYATQMWCQDGKMEPQPLEDPEAVAEQRAAMGLEPFEEYRKNFPETCE